MKRLVCCVLLMLLTACNGWNNPYPDNVKEESVLYTSFTGRPKHLDPAQSYSENEYAFLAQIYLPPLQYHYLKRPYQLVPLAASEMPKVSYLDKSNHVLSDDAPATDIAYSIYEIHIRDDMRYQPHPAFVAKHQDITHVYSLSDFPLTGTRKVTAADYVYQIKRLANPQLHDPIAGVMEQYIVGFKEFSTQLDKIENQQPDAYVDLNKYDMSGVQFVNDDTYRIIIKGKYPQFEYWLAMPFFAPMPYEAERFYAQPGMQERNLSLEWWPVGSGPYYLSENDPNLRMVLTRNPYYMHETYPAEGEPGDRVAGLLVDAGKPLPLIDKVVFSLEKETIPYWNKFLEGYYDASGISSDSFDQAVQVNVDGQAAVTNMMKAKGISLSTAVQTSTMYAGFNWLDPVVGGNSERARKLRQAISISVDYEEFISIFENGRGIAAQSPIPPGIFGYREGEAGIDPVVYDWVNGRPKRKPISVAKKLLAEAGYPDGVDAQTHQPLVINLDTTATGVGDKSRLDWMRKQFEKLNIQLVIRSTDYNRFQDKIRKGDTQMFYYGWNADYPDPENFLFLLSSAQAKVGTGGENASNYSNPEYDKLFNAMKNMNNTTQRQVIIDKMLDILHQDSPWLWGYHPKNYVLKHVWLYNVKPNVMANNNLKYWRVNDELREKLRIQWNHPLLWPLWLGVGIVFLFGIGVWWMLRRRDQTV